MARLDPLVGIREWNTILNYRTSCMRMLMASSKGSLMKLYGDGGTILPSLEHLYESFIRIESKSFNNYVHTLFIEAKEKVGSTLKIPLVDKITHSEGNEIEIIYQLDYIKNIIRK